MRSRSTQHAAAEESIHLRLARAVATHQPLERGRLVRRVVVDVHVRVLVEPLDDAVDETLEGAPLAVERELAGLVARPDGVEGVVGLEDAEQVVEPVVERVRVALDVERQVARRWRRERREPAIELDLVRRVGQEELVLEARFATTLELDPGLLVDTNEGALADVLERRLHRDREVAEGLERRHASLDQGATLPGGDPGDEAQVIVGASAGHAFGGPAADVAVLDGIGIGVRRRIRGGRLVRECREESVPGAAVVRHVVIDAQALDRSGAATERDVEPLRPDALDPLELVDVRADLEDGARLHVAGQLRVGDLVVVRAPARRPIRGIDPQ